ncbi:DUF1707 SHOCT-like domain-containing protein [Kibdelosporangium phytohabitans]|uniref:DUF1707 domain-containing protein n=1 Tax=Kibdelosporangium phytohabitans TaxID=860235 RepID=A0A0N9IGD4_9PSEU|nr:DUF1707 domain-containing protein [Kibdelosporangium phytohabitans]ALG14404.1 hypothetical protein AOZ06_52780 [Kibdelosporangium phytohabitans]MBE1466557.1 hypothetical protein [Kibdelosporangium phytohabitans]
MTDPRELRVTDSEREHVVGLLHKALSQALISLDEFTARTGKALAAVTRSELNGVLIDIPGLVRTDTVQEQRLELHSVLSKVRRRGQWDVPSELVVRCDQSACDLDFTVARIPYEVVRVEFDVRAAHVRVMLPFESTLDATMLQVLNCRYINKVRPGQVPGPRFDLSGKVRGGTLTITRPAALRLGSVQVRFPLKIDRIG